MSARSSGASSTAVIGQPRDDVADPDVEDEDVEPASDREELADAPE